MCVRAQDRQILGESVKQRGTGAGQLLTRRITANALWCFIAEPSDHGGVLTRRRRASGVIQGLRLNRRSPVAYVTEAGIEVVRAVGHPRHEHGNPVRRPQIAEYLNDPAVATWVERQELTALPGPLGIGRPGD